MMRAGAGARGINLGGFQRARLRIRGLAGERGNAKSMSGRRSLARVPLTDVRRPLDRFEWSCVALVAAAFALRIFGILRASISNDGARYAAMAVSFLRSSE